MATLTAMDKVKCEKLFSMEGGYVSDFSNETFGNFVAESINIDVYDYSSSYADHVSKAKKLRHLWSKENDNKVGKLILDLCEHEEAALYKYSTLNDENKSLLQDVRLIASKLKGEEIDISFPSVKEETFESLMKDIKDALTRNAPEFVLDRLHTFAMKMLRQICVDNKIVVVDPKGNSLPLHSLAGMLGKYYASNSLLESEFSIVSIKHSISLFDKYNDIRNNKSYAHDNSILDKLEAEYIVRIMAATVSFIHNIEQSTKKPIEPSKSHWSDIEDLPF